MARPARGLWKNYLKFDMRIALFSSTADPGNGYGNITVEYCRAMQAKGEVFTLFLPTSEKEAAGKYLPDIDCKFVLPPYIFEMKNPKSLLYLKRVDVSGFDLVHSLFDFPYCFIAARSAKKYGKPFMMGSQGTYGVVPLLRFPDRLALEWSYAQAKHIVVPSEFTRRTILQHTKRQYEIKIIHNGVNFSRFQTATDGSSVRSRYPGKTILLTVGGLKERKGQDLVLKALAGLRKSFDQFVYLIVGRGEWEKTLRGLAAGLGLKDHVHFLGSKEGAELVELFHSCDIYVHTPRVRNLNFEGFGIVYLEAGACGRPVVATDAGGVTDAVRQEETGIIAADLDVAGIENALKRLCSDPELRKKMGDAGRAYAQAHDWSILTDQFLALYRDMTHAK